MAQISKGDTFVDGQQVTGARLNQLVDSSQLLVGAITDQPSITANTLEATDSTIVNDGGVLKEATIGDILNSNLDATFDDASVQTASCSVINGKANKDINVTPNDGVLVTGKAFTSVDGITAVVTSVAHGLENNTCLNISASNAVYSGQYFITVISVDSFSYVIRQTNPVAASGTLDYTKKGTVKVSGSQSISGNFDVDGKVELNGQTAVSGSFISTGSSTFTGTSNFTGNLQVNGSTAYVLTDIIEESVPNAVGATANTLHSLFTSASYTKPAGELWVVEFNGNIYMATDSAVHWRITDSADTAKYSSSYWNNGTTEIFNFSEKFYLNSSNTHTGTFVFRAKALGANVTLNASSAQLSIFPDASERLDGKFRIYKYKTA